MFTHVTNSPFVRKFQKMNRENNFSREGLDVLYKYLEECEASIGEPVKLDVIALCREYSEDTYQNIADAYGVEIEEGDYTEEEKEELLCEAVRKYLEDKGVLVGEVEGGFVYQVH